MNRISLLVVTVLSFFLMAWFSHPATNGKKDIVIHLYADKEVYRLGELPVMRVEIENKGRKAICLPGSLDGSSTKFRWPHCYFEIQKPRPDSIVSPACRTTNPLRAADFKTIKRGARFDPYDKGMGYFSDHGISNPRNFQQTGLYTIRFHYNTLPANIDAYTGISGSLRNNKDSAVIMKLFAGMPHVQLVSNEVMIRFVP